MAGWKAAPDRLRRGFDIMAGVQQALIMSGLCLALRILGFYFPEGTT